MEVSEQKGALQMSHLEQIGQFFNTLKKKLMLYYGKTVKDSFAEKRFHKLQAAK